MRAWVAVLFLGCAPTVPTLFARATAAANAHQLEDALGHYDAIAARRDAREPDQALALLEAARLCDQLSDLIGARQRLESAVVKQAPEVAASIEFYLAEHLRVEDRGRALNLYYRAASTAEKQGGGFPYQAAMDRIVEMAHAR